VLAPGLAIVFCGINPGLYSGAVGHHFARPGNRFWPALHRAGFTDRLLRPEEDGLLPSYGVGVTNLVERASAAAAELGAEELRRGGERLVARLEAYRPRVVAILGMQAYRTAFGGPTVLGRAEVEIAGAPVFVLPNPSGLQARYQLDDLVARFDALRRAAGLARRAPSPAEAAPSTRGVDRQRRGPCRP